MANKRRVATWMLLALALSGSACCSVGMLLTVPTETHSAFVYLSHLQRIKKCAGNSCTEQVKVFSGSGFVIAHTGDNSWALTAAHLCTSGPSVTAAKLKASTRGGEVFTASIVHIFSNVDACVVAIHGAKVPAVTVADAAPSQGDYVTALGSPVGIYGNDLIAKFSGFYAGTTTGVRDPSSPGSVYAVLAGYTVPARPGSSGGPIFNEKGHLVGMVIMSNPAFESFALSPTFVVIQAIVKSASEVAKNYPTSDTAG